MELFVLLLTAALAFAAFYEATLARLGGEKLMATLADLAAAISDVQAAVTRVGTDVDAVVAALQAGDGGGGDFTPQVAALQAVMGDLTAAADKLEAALPPTPPVP
jgi:hypothetical protein